MPPRPFPGSFKEARRGRLQDVEDEASNVQEANWCAEQNDEGQGEQDEVLDAAEQPVLMAVATSGSQIGVAVYDSLASSISVFQSYDDDRGPQSYQLLQLIKLQANPGIIYTSPKADDKLLAALKRPVWLEEHDEDGGAESSSNTGFSVKLERATAFHYDKALKRLETLVVVGMAQAAQPKEHLALLNTLIDLTQELQVSALGALLLVLQKAGMCLGGEDGEADPRGGATVGLMHVQSLSEMALQGVLMVDPATLAALQIFQEERHASLMGIGSSKEGFSVYGIMQKCITHMGRRLMRIWFLRPVVNIDTINERLDAVELLVKSPELCKQLRDRMKQVSDLPKLLHKLQQVQMRPDARTFQQLQYSLVQMLQLKGIFNQLLASSEAAVNEEEDGPLLSWAGTSIAHKVNTYINEDLSRAYSSISNVIDHDQVDEGMLVAHGVCEELDTMKLDYQGLPDFLTSVVEEELMRVPPSVSRRNINADDLWSLVYLPQVGYVMRVVGRPLSVELMECLPDYKRAFEGHSEDGYAVYYHTNSAHDLSKRFGDLLYKIQDLEATICGELVRRLMAYTQAMHQAASVVAELDCLVSFALAARENNYCRPILTTECTLDIIKGRHPLTELVVPGPFIPNDTCMDQDSNRVHVITGPNASGKSCYSKQVAIIAYMGHLGSFVPAESAVIGLADRIFTRVISLERIANGHSSFMIDLTQVSRMLNKSTGHSIAVIDEFGKGTLAADGVGLLAAILRHFCQRPEPPRLLACTHYHEIFDAAVLPRHPQLAFYTMDVLVPPQILQANAAPQAQSPGTALFLYRLVPGYCAPTFGLHCAQVCGVRADVVARAQQVLQAQLADRPLILANNVVCTTRSRTFARWILALQALDLEAVADREEEAWGRVGGSSRLGKNGRGGSAEKAGDVEGGGHAECVDAGAEAKQVPDLQASDKEGQNETGGQAASAVAFLLEVARQLSGLQAH